jgi:hypothetical protein
MNFSIVALIFCFIIVERAVCFYLHSKGNSVAKTINFSTKNSIYPINPLSQKSIEISKLAKIGTSVSLILLTSAKLAVSDDVVVTAVDTVVAVDSFITTESGLKYKDTKVGTGEVPLPGDTG